MKTRLGKKRTKKQKESEWTNFQIIPQDKRDNDYRVSQGRFAIRRFQK